MFDWASMAVAACTTNPYTGETEASNKARLHQNLVAGEACHLLGHVGITNTRLGGLNVFVSVEQTLGRVLQTVLVGTEVGALLGYAAQRLVGQADYGVGLVRRADRDESQHGRVAQTQSGGGHRIDEDTFALVHVGADMEPHGSRWIQSRESSGQHLHLVELGLRRDPIDLVDQLADFHLDLLAVFFGVDTVGGLHGQNADTLENILILLEISFRRLDERNTVHRVPFRLTQTANLGSHFLRHGQASGVVPGAVDTQTGGQLLDVLTHVLIMELKSAMSEDRTDVMIDDHSSGPP